MNKEEQIREIETILASGCNCIPVKECHDRMISCDRCKAEMIYNANYRKQNYGKWTVSGRCTNCNSISYVRSKYCRNCGAKHKTYDI